MKNEKSENPTDSYKKGYTVSYSSDTASSSHGSLGYINIDNHQQLKSQREKVDANLIKDRCRIAIAGNGNSISIEGHADSKKLSRKW